MKVLAVLWDRHGRRIALVRTKKARLVWKAKDKAAIDDADYFVPLNEIPEDGGNPAAWAIHKLKGYLGGESLVMARSARMPKSEEAIRNGTASHG